MAATPLTSRERVNRAFERGELDRVPRHDSFWGETIARWQKEGLDGDAQTVLREYLRSDIGGVGWTWPQPYPGRREVIAEDEQTQTVIDGFGKTIRLWKGRSGTPEHHGFGCQTPDDWYNVYKPALLSRPVQIDVDASVRAAEQCRKNGLWISISGVEAFEQTRALLGDEIALMAMAGEPEWIRDISVTITDALIRQFEAVVERGVKLDGVWVFGDMAYNHATMCSPAMYRELIWPDHKRLADWAHAHGARFIYHTDGNVTGVLDLYLQAGFDGFHPIESKAGMDIREMGPRIGDRLLFFGNVDVMVMGSNDRGRIEAEVRSKLAAGMATRGYIYHSDHSVPPMVSWETYRYIIELLDRHGEYA